MRAAFLFVLVAASCAPPPPPPAPPPPPPAVEGPRLKMTAELGQIDEAATKQTFDRLGPALMRCYTDGLERAEYLAGDVKFFMRVNAEGRLKWAVVEQSSLGDRGVETCMLSVLTAASWPRPEGGEAEVHHGLGFDPPPGVKPPATWDSSKLAPALASAAKALAACKKHDGGGYEVTAYVASSHGVGRVVGAGASAGNAAAATDLDCILDVVRGLKLPNPVETPAKVTFTP